MIVKYDKFALWGISHWGKKRRQFYAFATSRESARDVYSKRRIIAVTKVEIVEWQDYKHLDWITVRRDDDGKSDKSQRLKTYCILCLLKNVFKTRLSSVACEDLSTGVTSHDPSEACTPPPKLLKVRKTLFQNSQDTLISSDIHSVLVDIEKVALSSSPDLLKSK
ncbi:hypothetical protein Tco_0654836 [Tanacetum coccineum]|uniref:AP2/ERF domain-containing protein n=1 Tax=Tanacetum coccineum TaxID=301880 RepID=A0ABQ4X4N0_9ASTR